MHPNPHPSDYPLAATREMLFVGFEGPIEQHIHHMPARSNELHYAVETNGFLAYRWLEQQVDDLSTFHLPYAVICYADWLMADQFRLVQQLAAHPHLCTVPVIAFAEKDQAPEPALLRSMGVDDCYTVPVDWKQVERRIEFLNQYKPRFLQLAYPEQADHFRLKIPFSKRLLDIIGASAGILLTMWIWAPVMLAIWLETRGPVIYTSRRVGYGYQVFAFLKFRSMFNRAEDRLQELEHLNQYQAPYLHQKPIFVKIANDPRVTRVGRFIRKYSIDELPQLINVLRGDMSLVGNRPLPVYEAEALTKDAWSARFLAPAGITGLWQVSKRGKPEMTVEERIHLDIAYAKTPYSIWKDLGILLKTFGAFIQQEDV
ncbi:MAG TPA: sugar transferase [Saprospiraceae bacterium]|nr:sugar transferase [Saprospiraceae bacterium]